MWQVKKKRNSATLRFPRKMRDLLWFVNEEAIRSLTIIINLNIGIRITNKFPCAGEDYGGLAQW
jgi:hypothetical protein